MSTLFTWKDVPKRSFVKWYERQLKEWIKRMIRRHFLKTGTSVMVLNFTFSESRRFFETQFTYLNERTGYLLTKGLILFQSGSREQEAWFSPDFNRDSVSLLRARYSVVDFHISYEVSHQYSDKISKGSLYQLIILDVCQRSEEVHNDYVLVLKSYFNIYQVIVVVYLSLKHNWYSHDESQNPGWQLK